MLKICTIYGIGIMFVSYVFVLLKMLTSNKTEDRVSSFLSILMNTPILYALIRLLQML